MTDEISTPEPPPGTEPVAAKTTGRKRPRGRTIAIIVAAAVVLAGGITFTSVSIAQAEAEETARQCTAALNAASEAQGQVDASVAKADESLLAVASVDLPETEGWTSTAYAERPGAEAVAAVEASEGVEAVEAVPERPSGAELIDSVTTGRDGLAEIELPTKCIERDDADKITKQANAASEAAVVVDKSVVVLTEDFAVFQEAEKVRIAAEIEAARIAAEKAAAEEAARKAAEEEAARQAEQQRWNNSNSGSRGNSNGSSNGNRGNSNGNSNGNSQPRPPAGGGPPGGGQIGDGSGGCRTDNGMGGTKPC